MLQDISIYCLIWENNRLTWFIYTLFKYRFENRDRHLASRSSSWIGQFFPSIHLYEKILRGERLQDVSGVCNVFAHKLLKCNILTIFLLFCSIPYWVEFLCLFLTLAVDLLCVNEFYLTVSPSQSFNQSNLVGNKILQNVCLFEKYFWVFLTLRKCHICVYAFRIKKELATSEVIFTLLVCYGSTPSNFTVLVNNSDSDGAWQKIRTTSPF